MPNTKSAWKRMRTSEEARLKNKAVRTRLRTARKAVLAAVQTANRDACRQAMSVYFSVLDKAVKGGVIRRNNADRHKSRAATAAKAVLTPA